MKNKYSDKIEKQTICFNQVTKKTEIESCPFWSTLNCKLRKIKCAYGLTNISVPKKCPLLAGDVIIFVKLKKPRKEIEI